MARSTLPHALQMRILKYGEAQDAERDQVAEALRAAGRRPEALLLYESRPEHPFLGEEAAWARDRGNGFHLLAVRRMGHPVADADLRACAAAAEQKGRWLDARLLHVALADDEALARIAEHLPEALRPAPPVT